MVEKLIDLKLAERLTDFLESGTNWERRTTNIPGVCITKIPESGENTPAKLAVELFQMHPSRHMSKGILIKSSAELLEYKKTLEKRKLKILLTLIDKLNGIEEKKESREIKTIKL